MVVLGSKNHTKHFQASTILKNTSQAFKKGKNLWPNLRFMFKIHLVGVSKPSLLSVVDEILIIKVSRFKVGYCFLKNMMFLRGICVLMIK